MGRCSVLECKSDSERKNPDISFHSFPDDGLLRKKWITATGRPNWTPKKASKICSKHFFQNVIYKKKKLTFLLPNAVPFLKTNATSSSLKASSCVEDEEENMESNVDLCSEVYSDEEQPSAKKNKKTQPDVGNLVIKTQSPNYTPRSLRRKLKKSEKQSEERRKKLKALREKSRRLNKKVANLENVIAELKAKSLVTEEDGELLPSIDPKGAFPNTLTNQTIDQDCSSTIRAETTIAQPCPRLGWHFCHQNQSIDENSDEGELKDDDRKNQEIDIAEDENCWEEDSHTQGADLKIEQTFSWLKRDVIECDTEKYVPDLDGDVTTQEPSLYEPSEPVPQKDRASGPSLGHSGLFICDVCLGTIGGPFRYSCVQCGDFDLCRACEANDHHADHFVLRVPAIKPEGEVRSLLRSIRQVLASAIAPSDVAIDLLKEEVKQEIEDVEHEMVQDVKVVPSGDPLGQPLPQHDQMPSSDNVKDLKEESQRLRKRWASSQKAPSQKISTVSHEARCLMQRWGMSGKAPIPKSLEMSQGAPSVKRLATSGEEPGPKRLAMTQEEPIPKGFAVSLKEPSPLTRTSSKFRWPRTIIRTPKLYLKTAIPASHHDDRPAPKDQTLYLEVSKDGISVRRLPISVEESLSKRQAPLNNRVEPVSSIAKVAPTLDSETDTASSDDDRPTTEEETFFPRIRQESSPIKETDAIEMPKQSYNARVVSRTPYLQELVRVTGSSDDQEIADDLIEWPKFVVVDENGKLIKVRSRKRINLKDCGDESDADVSLSSPPVASLPATSPPVAGPSSSVTAADTVLSDDPPAPAACEVAGTSGEVVLASPPTSDGAARGRRRNTYKYDRAPVPSLFFHFDRRVLRISL